MPSVVIVNPKLGDEAVRADFIRRNLEDLTERAAELYREDVRRNTGALEESIFADVAMTPEGYVGRVGATDWKAALVELGTRSMAPNGALRRSVESLGLKVDGIEIGSVR